MSAVPELIMTPEMLAKRQVRQRKREKAASPEGMAAAAAANSAEVEAKREARRARDAADAATLRKWAVRDGQGSPCELIDIGANLIKTKGDGAVEEQLQRCELTGVGGVIVTGTSVVDSRRALKLVRSTAAHAVKLYCTAGVHPHDAKSCDEETIGVLREMLQAPECVAVGECGLDYDRMFSRREVQLEWFERQAVLAVEQGMPLFLHERDVDADKGAPLGSAADLMGILDRAGVPPKRVCVHCFTGGEEVLRAYVDRGYYVGLTGFVAMEQRGARVREFLRAGLLPLEQLMLETDSPFMKPDKASLPNVSRLKRGPNEPCNMPAVCRAVAECLSVPAHEVADAVAANTRTFFGLGSGVG